MGLFFSGFYLLIRDFLILLFFFSSLFFLIHNLCYFDIFKHLSLLVWKCTTNAYLKCQSRGFKP